MLWLREPMRAAIEATFTRWPRRAREHRPEHGAREVQGRMQIGLEDRGDVLGAAVEERVIASDPARC